MLIIMFNKSLESSGLQQLIWEFSKYLNLMRVGVWAGWLMSLSQIGYLIVTKSL